MFEEIQNTASNSQHCQLLPFLLLHAHQQVHNLKIRLLDLGKSHNHDNFGQKSCNPDYLT